MQIVINFQYNRHLIRQCAGAADVLLGDSGAVQTIEHTKHAEQFSTCSQERNSQELVDLIFSDNIEVRALLFAGLVGPENLFRSQSARGDSFWENCFCPARHALLNPVADAEGAILQQGDEAAAEGKKICGAHYEGLQELLKISAGAKFGRNFEQLMKLVSLGVSRGIKLGVSHGHRAETGDG